MFFVDLLHSCQLIIYLRPYNVPILDYIVLFVIILMHDMDLSLTFILYHYHPLFLAATVQFLFSCIVLFPSLCRAP